MTGSIIPGTIDALVTLFTGITGLTCIDGPGATDAHIPNALFIGVNDPDDDPWTESAQTDQVWPWLGHQMRDETALIHCVAEAWDGGGNMQTVRNTVFATVTAIATAIQTDPSLSGAVVYTASAVKAGTFKQSTDQNGCSARLQFDIEVRGRIS